jgi:galactokinase
MKKKLIKYVKKQFKKSFKKKPLLVFSPGRINLIGEHTDYNDGFAFPAAIDKGIAAAIAKSKLQESTIIALDKNESYTFQLKEVEPLKNGGWRNYILGVVGELQKSGIELGNFNLVFSGNIPGGSGMSSSAALENSVVFALNELFQLGLSKNEMIFISQKAEHNYAKVNCGIMDQYASMFGEKKSALLLDCRTITSDVFQIDFKPYQLLLINTNVKHDLSESAYNDRRAVCESVSALLKVEALRDATELELMNIKKQLKEEDFLKALYIIQENKRVRAFMTAAENNDVKTLGELLYQSHDGLSNQFQVSCAELDFLVDFAKKSTGVIGSRMMGGGFGGCTINLVHKDELKKFKKKVRKAYAAEFNNECSIYKVKLSKGTYLVE